MNSEARLRIVLLITFVFMIVEVIAGYISNSLALLADAGHMLNDVISITLAILAISLSKLPATRKRSFGYKRMEVFAGLINGVGLLGIGVYIIIEAVLRFNDIDKVVIDGQLMFSVAIIGLLINIIAVYLLLPSKDEGINIAGAFYHVVADVLGSLAAIIAGIGILFWNWVWLDLVASIMVSLLILKSGQSITVKAVKILSEECPDEIDLEKTIGEIASLSNVKEVHDIHAWRITDGLDVLTLHLTVYENSNQDEILHQSRIIAEEHGFHHVTIQVELIPCIMNPDCN